jgi:hypothetical protein
MSPKGGFTSSDVLAIDCSDETSSSKAASGKPDTLDVIDIWAAWFNVQRTGVRPQPNWFLELPYPFYLKLLILGTRNYLTLNEMYVLCFD